MKEAVLVTPVLANTETVIFKQFNNRVVLSPAFLYYKEREMEGTLPEDSGAQSRTIFQVLNQFGCRVESADPYNTANMNVPPTQVQLNDAALRKIGAYHRILDVGSVMSCIESGYTCTIAIAVYQSFEDAASGIIPLPNKSTEGLLGGHEMYLWGFDIQGNAAWNPFKVRELCLETHGGQRLVGRETVCCHWRTSMMLISGTTHGWVTMGLRGQRRIRG